MSNKIRASALALILSTGCTQNQQALEQTEKTIGTNGGATQSADGVLTVLFSANALSAATTVRITTLRDRSLTDGLSGLYTIETINASQFETQGQVRISIQSSVTPGASSDAVLVSVDPSTLATTQIEDSEFIDGPNRALGTITRPGTYALVRVTNACDHLACGLPCTMGHVVKHCNASHRCVTDSQPLNCPGGDGGFGFDGGVFPCGDGDFGFCVFDAGGNGCGDANEFCSQDAGGFPFIPDGGSVDCPPDGGGCGLFDASTPPGDGGGLFCSNPDGGSEIIDGSVIQNLTSEIEPNNAASPQLICLDFFQTVTISAHLFPNDEDVYAFFVPSGGLGGFRGNIHSDPLAMGICDNGLSNWTIELFDQNFVRLASSNDRQVTICPEINFAKDVGASRLLPGMYLVRITRPSPGAPTQAYFTSFQLFPVQAGDGGIIPQDAAPNPGDGNFIGPDAQTAPDAGMPTDA